MAVKHAVMVGVALAASFASMATADAHEAGLSRGRYDLREHTVAVHLVFANVELANALPTLDADHGGTLSAQELESNRSVLDKELADRLAISADGKACPVILGDASLSENDGVSVAMTADCGTRPTRLLIHCGFLEVLSSSHHHWAVVSTEEGKDRPEVMVVPANLDLEVDVRATPQASSGFVSLLKLGVEHILTGYDHLVFLLGLILLGGRARSLVAALTAFTLAHSISLALAVLSVWSPNPSIVEPAIALSIAYVGIENLWLSRKRSTAPSSPGDAARGRWRITFPFGLIHGFGFAGALTEIGLPRARIPGALIAFNLGVEAGQLAVLAALLPGIYWLSKRDGATRWVRGASWAIVVAGIYWFVTRIRSA